MEVYESLVEAVRQLGKDDTRRVYKITRHENTGCIEEYYVLAKSPAQAALAVIGEDNVSLVGMREKMEAAFEALQQYGTVAK